MVAELGSVEDRGGRVCIVGAGPAGLSMARALRGVGVEYDQYERHTDLGGLWDPSNPGSPVYKSAHFISSRDTSGFFEFPMPKHFPDYPSNRQILEYTRSFANAFGLREAIRFGAAVEHVEAEGERWLVRTADGKRYRYRAVICANGHNWHPRFPRHPGQFNGEIRHSVTYSDPAEFQGKRVLIIGAGKRIKEVIHQGVHVEPANIEVDLDRHIGTPYLRLPTPQMDIFSVLTMVIADFFCKGGEKDPKVKTEFVAILKHLVHNNNAAREGTCAQALRVRSNVFSSSAHWYAELAAAN